MNLTPKINKNFSGAVKRLTKKYGEGMLKLNNIDKESLNYTSFIDQFVDKKRLNDVSANPSANNGLKDVVNLKSNINESHFKLLCYSKIFYEITKKHSLEKAKEWLEHEWIGSLYMHDASTSTLVPYCYAMDLKRVAEKGLYFIDKFKTGPPMHLGTFSDHFLQTCSWMSNRQSGAVGFPSFFVYSYYFWYNDIKNNYYLKNPEYYREQHFQKIIYDLNQPFLRGNQSAFTNFSIMDREYLIALFGDRKFPNNEPIMDHIEGIIQHQKVYLKTSKRVWEEMGHTFPVLTYSLLFQEGEFVDKEFARFCSDINYDWMDGNFFTGSDVTSLSNCCRLISDTTKLKAFINSIGGTALSIGSVKVNTINLRRIALESNCNKEKYIEILKERVELCLLVLDRVRRIISRNISKNLLPNYTYKLIEMNKQYNTIGCTAMYETLVDFGFINNDEFGNKSYKDEGLKFAQEIMQTINDCKDKYAEDKKYSINVEFVPGESCNIKLAKKDALLYPDATDYYIYGNQWIPLREKCTLDEKIKLGSLLDKECGGGQISHININGRFSDKEQGWKMLNKVAKAGVIYFAFNSIISVCEDNHSWIGKTDCPKCGKPAADYFTRIVGFLTPVSSYSTPREKEFNERKWYNLNEN